MKYKINILLPVWRNIRTAPFIENGWFNNNKVYTFGQVFMIIVFVPLYWVSGDEMY